MLPDVTKILEPTHMAQASLAPLWDSILARQASPDSVTQRFRFSHYMDKKKQMHPARYGDPLSQHELRKLGRGVQIPGHRRGWAKGPIPDGPRTDVGRSDPRPNPQVPTDRPAAGSRGSSNRRVKSSVKGKGKSKGKARATSADLEDDSEDSDGYGYVGFGDSSGSSAEEDVSPAEAEPRVAPRPRPVRQGGRKAVLIPNVIAERPPHSPLNGPISAGLEIQVPPNESIVSDASRQAPNWVLTNGHPFVYLWALSGEPEYRRLLTSWRHMVCPSTTFSTSFS